MENGFQFELLWNDDDVLQVRIRASNGKFRGTADVYVRIGGLAEAAAKLDGFPRNPSDRRELQFGAFGAEMAGGAVEMRFYCTGAAGRTFIETRVESDHNTHGHAETAHFIVPVEASAVDEFVSQLRTMESDRHGAAHLNVLVVA